MARCKVVLVAVLSGLIGAFAGSLALRAQASAPSSETDVKIELDILQDGTLLGQGTFKGEAGKRATMTVNHGIEVQVVATMVPRISPAAR